MRSSRTVLCLLGAFIGVGFASGREIMRFFTRYGPLSVPLLFLAAGGGMAAAAGELWALTVPLRHARAIGLLLSLLLCLFAAARPENAMTLLGYLLLPVLMLALTM